MMNVPIPEAGHTGDTQHTEHTRGQNLVEGPGQGGGGREEARSVCFRGHVEGGGWEEEDTRDTGRYRKTGSSGQMLGRGVAPSCLDGLSW